MRAVIHAGESLRRADCFAPVRAIDIRHTTQGQMAFMLYYFSHSKGEGEEEKEAGRK